MRPGGTEGGPFLRGDDVAVDSNQLAIVGDEVGPVAREGVVEQAEVLEVGLGDLAFCELVVVEVEDAHEGKVGEPEGHLFKLVGGKVKLDQGNALVDGRYLCRSDLRPCQDQQLETRRVLDELAYLQVLLNALFHLSYKGDDNFIVTNPQSTLNRKVIPIENPKSSWDSLCINCNKMS